MRWWQNPGLNFKVALGISLTLIIVLGISFFGISQFIRARLWESEIQKTQNINAIARILLDDAMLAGRKDTIHAALVTLGQSAGNQQLDSIAVYDDEYQLTSFASGFPGGITVSRGGYAENCGGSFLLGVSPAACRGTSQIRVGGCPGEPGHPSLSPLV